MTSHEGYLRPIIVFAHAYLCIGAWELKFYDTKMTQAEASLNCSRAGLTLAKIDTLEKWNQAKFEITNDDRNWPFQDIYIGMTFRNTSSDFRWTDDSLVTWTQWYQNEPFDKDTRTCVTMAMDADLYFRTSACRFQIYFVCSNIETPTTPAAVEKKRNSTDWMIIGLSVGFGMAAAILVLCVCMCKFCFPVHGEARKEVYVPRRRTPKKTKKGHMTEMTFHNPALTDNMGQPVSRNSASPNMSTGSQHSVNDSANSSASSKERSFHNAMQYV